MDSAKETVLKIPDDMCEMVKPALKYSRPEQFSVKSENDGSGLLGIILIMKGVFTEVFNRLLRNTICNLSVSPRLRFIRILDPAVSVVATSLVYLKKPLLL